MRGTKAKFGAIAGVVAAAAGGYVAGKKSERADFEPVPLRRSESQVQELQRLQQKLADRDMRSAELARETAALRAEIERLQRELQEATVHAQPSETRPDPLATLRILQDLRNRQLVFANVDFIKRQGELSAAFIELFSLTPDERDTLQQALDQARQQLDGVALVHALVSRPEPGKVVIEIPPTSGGGEIFDRVFDVFARTLGPDRNALFFELGSSQIERTLNQFGAEQRTITLTREAATIEGAPKIVYQIDDKRTGTAGFSTSGSLLEREGRDAHLGAIAKLVPADF